MQYLGGKIRISGAVSGYINSRLDPDVSYWEPFCGACGIMSKIDENRDRLASDIHPDLMMMWEALQWGWIPPDHIYAKDYQTLKSAEPSALRGFVGFGCSFAGKWFGGYAKSEDRNYASGSNKSLMKKMSGLKGVDFRCGDYREIIFDSGLIYCDPPYIGTTGYLDEFDHEVFWDWARERARNSVVLVSEYSAPSDFKCVFSISTKTDIRMKDGSKSERVEKIFEYNYRTH